MASSSTVEYLQTTRMGEKGQLTVPKVYRDALHLDPGAPVTVLRIGNGLMLIPENKRFEALCDSIRSRMEKAGLTVNDLLRTLPETRRRVFARRCPSLVGKLSPRRSRPRKKGR